MALPTTITGLLVTSASKPFISSSGNVYVIGAEATNRISAYKATDPTSSFTNVGTDITLPVALVTIDAFQVGDVIHVATYMYFNGDNRISYHAFDMSSDSWTTSNEVVKGTFSTAAATGSEGLAAIAVRSDGDIIIFYRGPSVANMGSQRERVYYARKEGSWTVDVSVDDGGGTHWYPGGIVRGSSDRMHFFFIDDGASDAYQRTLTSANALETFPSSYEASVSTVASNLLARGASYDDAGTTRVRFPTPGEDTGGTPRELHSAKLDSADAPTVSLDSDITGAENYHNFSGRFKSSFAADGTTLWNTFIHGTDADIYTQSNADDAGWDTPASFYTGTATEIHTNVYTRGSNVVLAMVFFEGSNVLYHEKTLSAGTTDAAFSMSAAASTTWSGESTATSDLSATAAASVTWNEASSAVSQADWSVAAAGTLTMAGASLADADWSAIAVATLTFDTRELHSADWSAAATASVTWDGAQLTLEAADWSSQAAASLAMEGAATAASALSAAAVATLTMEGAATYASAWNAAATASLAATGASIADSAWSSSAVATLTLDGAEVTPAALSAAAAATLTWEGEASSVASAAWNATAAGNLAMTGAATSESEWNSQAAATLAATGGSIVAGDWNALATATLTATGATTVAGDWNSLAAASLTFDTDEIRSGSWSAAASATLTMEGVEVSGAFTEAELDADATASVVMAAEATAASAIDSQASVVVTFAGVDATPPAGLSAIDRDGWRRAKRRQEELEAQDEEDIMLITAAIYAYMEQNHGYY